MISRTFRFERNAGAHEGFMPDWMPTTDSTSPLFGGSLAAHDCLEHMKPWVGFEGEMMAFGQMWFIRVNGHMTPSGDLLRGYAIDLEQFGCHVINGDETLNDPPPQAWRLLRKAQAGDYGLFANAEELESTVRVGFHRAVRDMTYGSVTPHEELFAQLPEDYVERTMAWMYLGYELGRRRWERIGLRAYQAADLFRDVEQAVSRLDLGDDDDGDRIIVSIDCRRRQVKARKFFRDDPTMGRRSCE